MDSYQETVRAVISELVAISFKGFALALPHAKAIVGLRAPICQVVHNNFFTRIIATDTLENNLTLTVVHLRVSYTTIGVDIP